MEKDFRQWFHENTTCKKLDTRLDRQVLVISLLTTVDTAYSVYYSKVFEHLEPESMPPKPYFTSLNFIFQVDFESTSRYMERLRLPVFLLSRLAILFIILSWRVAYASQNVRPPITPALRAEAILSYKRAFS